MADEILADDVKGFILSYVSSIAELEALLLLRASPDLSWDAAATARRLYVKERESGEILARLSAQRLIVRHEDGYRYYPDVETAALIDRVAEAYARHLIPVTDIIHQKLSRIGEFANAFRLKKEE